MGLAESLGGRPGPLQRWGCEGARVGDVLPRPLVEAMDRRAQEAGISRAEAFWALQRILERGGDDLLKGLRAEEELVRQQKRYRQSEFQHYKTHRVLEQERRAKVRLQNRCRAYRQFINHRRGRPIDPEDMKRLSAGALGFELDQEPSMVEHQMDLLRAAQPEKPPPDDARTSVSQVGRKDT